MGGSVGKDAYHQGNEGTQPMTDLINPANWGGAQWVLLCLVTFGLISKKDELLIQTLGAALMLSILAWGGFWA